MLRVCKKCKVEKEFTCYIPRKDCRDGISPTCKDCFNKSRPTRKGSKSSKDYWKKWYNANKEGLLNSQKDDLGRKTYSAKRYKKFHSVIKKKQAEYRKTSGYKVLNCSKAARRRASKLSATPAWLCEEHKQKIDYFYWLARDLTTVSGETYHVDHIVPLKGKSVCGLHVPWNLQILPADINLSKSNKF
jgi:hypothetical protein